MGLFFCVRKSPHIVFGCMKCGGEQGKNGGVLGTKNNKKKMTWVILYTCVLAAYPPAAPVWKRNKTGGSKSPECVHHIASQFTCEYRWVGAAEGSATSATSRVNKKNPNIKKNKKTLVKLSVCLCVTMSGHQFGIRFWKGDGDVLKVCAKILVRLLLEYQPFYFFNTCSPPF